MKRTRIKTHMLLQAILMARWSRFTRQRILEYAFSRERLHRTHQVLAFALATGFNAGSNSNKLTKEIN